MLEQKRPPKSRGFYVKMRLLHKHGRPHEKSFFFRYYKWVLWLSLTLYFFSSYLISNNPQSKLTSLSKTHVSNSKSNLASRALIELNGNATQLQTGHQSQGYFQILRSHLCSLFLFHLFKFHQFYFAFDRVIEQFEDLRVRFATEIQYGLALKRAMQQPLVRFGGGHT